MGQNSDSVDFLSNMKPTASYQFSVAETSRTDSGPFLKKKKRADFCPPRTEVCPFRARVRSSRQGSLLLRLVY